MNLRRLPTEYLHIRPLWLGIPVFHNIAHFDIAWMPTAAPPRPKPAVNENVQQG